jgi:ABC-2 type transport system ATP-binding protein
MASNDIIVEGLHFSYGSCHVLRGVDLNARSGEILGLLGPNGAGKSTLINVLTTLLVPGKGRAWVGGYDVVKQSHEVRRRICLLMQQGGMDLSLNVYDNLYFYAGLQGIPRRERRARIDAALDIFGLGDKKSADVQQLSGGLFRRMMIARLLLSPAKIFFLDEPTAGIDVRSRGDFWRLLKLLRTEFNLTVVLATHDLEEAGWLCDRICFIKEGLVVALDTVDNLRQRIDKVVITLSGDDDSGPVTPTNLLPGVYSERRNGRGIELVARNSPQSIEGLLSIIRTRPDLKLLELRQPTLTDIFKTLVADVPLSGQS